jgi:transaldolase
LLQALRPPDAPAGPSRARRLWSDLIRVGVDEDEVGEQLEEEGVEKFAASYRKVLDTIEDKRTQIIERDAAAMSS